MPNNVTNEIKFYGQPEDIKAVRSLIKGSKDDLPMIDFNRLIPMPESLNIEEGSMTRDAIRLYLTMMNPDAPYHDESPMSRERFGSITRKLSKMMYMRYTPILSEERIREMTRNTSVDDLMDLGAKAVHNLVKYGAVSWYDWCLVHWGTKWNAYYQYSDSDDSIGFDTANSMPEPILERLAEICDEHDVCFEGQWINEDWRCDSGSFESDGDMLHVYQDETEEQARERCKDLLNWDPVEDEDDSEEDNEDEKSE